MIRLFWPAALAAALLATPQAALAQTALDNLLPQGGPVSARLVQMGVLLTILSVAPGLLIMVTSFTRFAVALSFLRAGLGLQSTPANMVLISLAMFMTGFVMAPTFDKAWSEGVRPLMDNRLSEAEAMEKTLEPFRTFMARHVREKDLKLFEDLAPADLRATAGPPDLRILVPAFMVSELRRGFEIGFLIILPFLIIDMVVATLTMAMGMMMLPPTIIALPLKVLFFVLVDGWSLVVGSLLRSYG